MTDRIRLQIDGGIARLTLCASERRNAVDLAFARDFAQAALDVAADASVRVTLLAAEGAMFSVGGDLAEMVAERSRAERHVLEMASQFHLGIERLHRSDAPLVVALNGTAAGGGYSLVLGADIAVAARSAKLVAAYTRSGLTPDGGATWFLPRAVGRQRAFQMLALNPVLSAEQAAALGLIAEVVDDEALESESLALARKLAALPAGAGAALKRLTRASADNGLSAQLALEAGSIARSAAQPETQAALDAFFRKSR